MRVKHGFRIEVRHYVGEDGKCPACKRCFVTRLRCLSHLGDSRRPKCKEAVLGGSFERLAQDEVDRLDAADRDALCVARKGGHTHVMAKGSATDPDGKVIGRVRL